MEKIPKISVIMGIYNCEKTLSESIDSLFYQTFQDFELIMCDDGSNDNTYTIATEYANKFHNIILLRNVINKGLNYTLNYSLKHARGEYIARQDGDDISLPTRFEKEISFLDAHDDIALVSCSLIAFDMKGNIGIMRNIPYPKKKDFRIAPFFHPSCMIRKSVLDDVEGYTESKRLLRVEDYHLWCKIYAKGYTGHNIAEPLYKFRDDAKAYKRRKFKYRLNEDYVTFIGVKMLNLPIFYYIWCFRT
jgi:glycosyltransferase EpsE